MWRTNIIKYLQPLCPCSYLGQHILAAGPGTAVTLILANMRKYCKYIYICSVSTMGKQISSLYNFYIYFRVYLWTDIENNTEGSKQLTQPLTSNRQESGDLGTLLTMQTPTTGMKRDCRDNGRLGHTHTSNLSNKTIFLKGLNDDIFNGMCQTKYSWFSRF